MNLQIRGNDIKITEYLDDFARKKLSKLERYLPNISEVRLDLSRKKTRSGPGIFSAQITLRHSRGAILRSEQRIDGIEQDAVQKSIVGAINKMYRQIDRFKGKREVGRRKGADYKFIATAEEIATSEDIPEDDEFMQIAQEYQYEEDVEAGTIVRRKEVVLHPMTEDEAIEQMELLGHDFFMFLNGKSGEINVVYLRKGGGYGILIPTRES
ncbi:MAG: ribosomal subunit interface protein [Phototrophicales bacterium]|nr:MAG: ribosomal subunit interface protein [Phototrophicales bacterium]